MPRLSVCAAPGCYETVAAGSGRCPEHARPAWQNPSKHTLTRPRDWKRRRARALARDRRRCVMCGGPGTEVDHIVPVAKGGSWEIDNLQTLCVPHHAAKSRMDRRSA